MRCRPMKSWVCPDGSWRTVWRSHTFCRSVLPIGNYLFYPGRETRPRYASSRDALVVRGPTPPWPLGADVDADTRAPIQATSVEPAILNPQATAREIETVLRQRDAQCLREIAGAATELGLSNRLAVRAAPGAGTVRLWRTVSQRCPVGSQRDLTLAKAAFQHQRDAIERRERANQHGCRRALGFGHSIHQIVHAVIEIDVRDAGRSIERFIALRRPGRCVARGIVFSDVGFGLDDHSSGDARARLMHEHLADHIGRDVERRTIVEVRRERLIAPHTHSIDRSPIRAVVPVRCTTRRPALTARAFQLPPIGRPLRRLPDRDRCCLLYTSPSPR